MLFAYLTILVITMCKKEFRAKDPVKDPVPLIQLVRLFFKEMNIMVLKCLSGPHSNLMLSFTHIQP
jgi:hypothetical protein